jgi:hypothetical protein
MGLILSEPINKVVEIPKIMTEMPVDDNKNHQKRPYWELGGRCVVMKSRGGRKMKRENDVHLRQLAKKVRTYLLLFSFFLVRFWAFLGKGSSKTREKKLSTFQKKSPGKYFFGGNFF